METRLGSDLDLQPDAAGNYVFMDIHSLKKAREGKKTEVAAFNGGKPPKARNGKII